MYINFVDFSSAYCGTNQSSSRGVFGSLENERKRREKRENETLKLKAAGDIYINEKLHKVA